MYGVILASGSGTGISSDTTSTIKENVIYFQFRRGVYVSEADNNLIAENTFLSSNVDHSYANIYLYDSNHNSVSSNTITMTNIYEGGIVVFQSSNNIISENIIKQNGINELRI